MGTMRRKTTGAIPHAVVAAVHRGVALVSWTVLGTGVVANGIAQSMSPHWSEAIVATTLSILFPLLVVRLALAAWLSPGRRGALVVLLAAVAAWSLASMLVTAASSEEQAHFPAPGEWVFLVSYIGMAGYLLLDIDRKQLRPSVGWLDIAVICGGTACLASLMLVAPIRIASRQEGLPLLLALMYPLADTILALVVLGQALSRARTDRRQTIMIGAAFLMLAAGDSAFALQDSARTYEFDALNNAMWGGSFAVLVAAACRSQEAVIKVIPKRSGTKLVVGAGIIAVAVLTLRPQDTLAYYILPPAVLTLMAAAARMGLALRDANRAAEAFALSQTDDLTMLPNRRAVRARLQEGIADGRPLALMLLDLDGFKEINDALGHQAGDIVLRFVAVRMRESVPADVMVARLGGDEFAILLRSNQEIELMETAQQILAELSKPVFVDGIEICPSGSVGVAVVSDTDTEGGEVLRRADVAMYQAKGTRTGAALYDAHLDEFSRSRLLLAEDLRKGIAEDQIELWYQPQVDAATKQIRAVEALVRWRHPTEGLLSPVAFLPAARRAGLMGALSDRIAQLAVRDLHRFLEVGLDLRVAINCAPPELLSNTFLPRLYACLDEWDVPGDHIVLEVTEDAFLADPQRARNILLDLRSHGVQVSIDDYGTGFSSLTYLRDLPVQELKIDRSLIRDVATDARTRMIVASTVQLAHALDMRTVAEGVEQADDYAELVAIGIDVLQGYHFARPLPASEIEHWVQHWTTAATFLDRGDSASAPVHTAGGWRPGSSRATRILDSSSALTKRNTER